MPRQNKPAKPYPDFPLFAHATGRWAKKIRGKFHYFGPWGDWRAALERYKRERDDLYAGRVPKQDGDGHDLEELAEVFLNAKRAAVETGELAAVTWQGYQQSMRRMLAHLGRLTKVSRLTPDDWHGLRSKLQSERGVTSLANDVNRIRVFVNWVNARHMKGDPIDVGPDFVKPSKKQLRLVKPVQFFRREQILSMLSTAKPHMCAMILLGINCGFGNEDCASLTKEYVGPWLNFPRTKNGNPRRCPLWTMTRDFICQAIEQRPAPSDPSLSTQVFLTAKGGVWARPNDRPLSKEFRKLLRKCGLQQVDLGFYTLRRTFRTVADSALDRTAIDYMMGHVDPSTGATYRQLPEIDDARLLHVSEVVAEWLFGSAIAARAQQPQSGRNGKCDF